MGHLGLGRVDQVTLTLPHNSLITLAELRLVEKRRSRLAPCKVRRTAGTAGLLAYTAPGKRCCCHSALLHLHMLHVAARCQVSSVNHNHPIRYITETGDCGAGSLRVWS
jgi:hypothetical protein